jgi:Zn-dependent protease
MIQTLFSSPITFLVYALALLVVVSVHEFSHALAADRLGDPTPRLQGRLSLNPLKHLDPLGTLMILFIGFGWGKPVSFDPFNLQNPRKDAAIISLAGPASNFILALILSIVLRLFILLKLEFLAIIGLTVFLPMIKLSILLGVFNLIPVHPLDGFKIVGGILPQHKAEEWYALQRYGIFVLLLIIFPFNGQTSMLDLILRPVYTFIVPLFVPGT